MPDITGNIAFCGAWMDLTPVSVNYAAGGVADGAFEYRNNYQQHFGGIHAGNSVMSSGAQFKASRTNKIYNGEEVIPNSVTIIFCLKY